MSALPNRSQRTGSLDLGTLIGLLVLLIIPVVALSRMAPWVDWRVLAGVPLAASCIAWLAYWSDKRRAEAGEWRIPEVMLHLMELSGGWPGAFLAQRKFRHKTSKASFQIIFWLIVLLHQYLALDFLLGWKLTHGLVHSLKALT